MNKLATVSALAALAMGGSAMAADFSYDYVEGGLVLAQAPGSNDGKGLAVNFSKGLPQVHENFTIIGGASYLDFDYGYELLNLSGGAGFHWPVASIVDVVGGLTLEYFDNDFDSDIGLGVMGGARVQPFGEEWEFNGGLRHVDAGAYEDTFVEVGARYTFKPGMSGGLKLSTGDIDTWTLSFRWEM